MKIKLVEPGYENMTGMFGSVEFEDGVSKEHVSSAEARFLASIIRVVDAETDEDPGTNAFMQAMMDTPAPVEDPMLRGAAAFDKSAEQAAVPPEQAAATLFTRDQLEAVADKHGISGLREIGDTLGVKSTSIAGLIKEIMDAQQGPAPAAGPLAEGRSDDELKSQE